MRRPQPVWSVVAVVVAGLCPLAAPARAEAPIGQDEVPAPGESGAADSPSPADQRGGISGVILDRASGEPLIGVTVVVAVDHGTISDITDGEGRYHLDGVPAGRWDVTAYYIDVTTRRVAVEVAPAATAIVPFAIDTAQMGDFGCVFDEPPPRIDIADAGLRQDRDDLGRDTLMTSWWSTVGATIGSVTGGRIGHLDLFDDRGLPAPAGLLVDFTDEIDIVTAGQPARFGGRLGTVAEVTPRRGSNESHGSVFARGGAGQATAGLEMGGPISIDHAWYHIGLAPTHAGGRDQVQMISQIDWAIDFEHQGGLAAWSVDGESAVGLHWRSRFDDNRKEIAAAVGWLAVADTLNARIDTTWRKRAVGHHWITGGLSVVDARADTLSGAAYLADAWSVRPNLTINAGLRYQRVAIRDTTPPAATGPDLCGDPCQQVAAVIGGLAPRIGVVYDFTREGRSRLFAHYARYLETVGLPGFGGDLVRPGLRPARVDEGVLGVEYNPLAVDRLVAGVAYVARRQDRDLAVISIADGAATVLANPPTDRRADLVRLSARYRGRDLTLDAEYNLVARGSPVLEVAEPGLVTARLRAIYETWESGRHGVDTAIQLRLLDAGPTIADFSLDYRFHFGCAVDDLDLYVTGFDLLRRAPAGVPRGAMIGARLAF